MADQFGSLTFPAEPTLGSAPSDRALDSIGGYLKAVINAQLGGAWNAIAPGEPPVRSVSILDPKVCSLNERDLPGLFVWRSRTQEVRETDEWHTDHSEVSVLWIPVPVPQAKLSARAPFFNGIAKTIFVAMVIGRHRAWIAADDADPDARTLGSVLADVGGFMMPPKILNAAPELTTITTDDAQGKMSARKYPSVLARISCVEPTTWDPELRGSPAAHTTTVTNNDVELGEIQNPLE